MSLREILAKMGPLGFLSFGGPNVHIILFRRLFVDCAVPWLDARTFADLFSLSGALPGPGSTQLLFSIALVRSGILAGLLTFFLWTLPGAIGMFLLGLGVSRIPGTLPPLALAVLTGLNASSVGLIFYAAYQLSASTATTTLTRLVLFASASVASCYSAVWLFPVLTVGGGLVTLVASWAGWRDLKKNTLGSWGSAMIEADSSQGEEEESIAMAPAAALPAVPAPIARLPTPPPEPNNLRHRPAVATERAQQSTVAPHQGVNDLSSTPIRFKMGLHQSVLVLALFFGVLIVVVALKAKLSTPPRALQLFTNLFIAGSILFGGGPVVVPLLQGYTVSPGWVTTQQFLLGFAVLQAFPGPNFNFAVFLGCLSLPHNPVLGGILAYLGIFAPGILLKLALLPTYTRFRHHPVVRSSLLGLNSAATGLVWTAVYRLWRVGLLTADHPGKSLEASGYWVAVAGAAFMASQYFKVPPPVVIVAGAFAGLLYGGVKGAPAST